MPTHRSPERVLDVTTARPTVNIWAWFNRRHLASLSRGDALVFASGHRLSPAERENELSKLAFSEIASRGLRFSDEPARNADARAMREVASPFRTTTILALLWNSTDALTLELWIDTMTNGANMLFNGNRVETSSRNRGSVALLLAETQALLRHEHSRGWTSAFSDKPPLAKMRVSPLHIIPKDSSPIAVGISQQSYDPTRHYRLIHDLSARSKEFGSVNDSIDVVHTQYAIWSKVVLAFIAMGRDGHMVKVDFKNAYRQVSIRWQDRQLLGFFCEGLGYGYYLCAPFGGSSSSFNWDKLAQCFLKVVEVICVMIALIIFGSFLWADDVLFLCGEKRAALRILKVVKVSAELGWAMNEEKEQMSQSIQFTGVTLDSRTMTLSIAAEKRLKAKALICLLRPKQLWTLEDLQKLAGHINNFAKVLVFLRPFVAFTLQQMHAAEAKRIRAMPPGELLDMALMLERILDVWCGSAAAMSIAPLMGGKDTDGLTTFFIDASETGVGFWSPNGFWSEGRFDCSTITLATRRSAISSTFIECIGMLSLLSTAGGAFRGKAVRVMCDSKDTVDLMHSRRSNSCSLLSGLLRNISVLQAAVGWTILVSHIPRQLNKAADALSRGDITSFRKESGCTSNAVEMLRAPTECWMSDPEDRPSCSSSHARVPI